MSGKSRELAHDERAAIKALVTKSCANYHHEYGCLPLDGACYMLLKWWTDAYCKYFREAVLPLNPALEAALTGGVVELRACAACGQPFHASGKKAYCTAGCEKTALRKQKRNYMRKKRFERGNLPL